MFGLTSWEKFQKKVKLQAESLGFDNGELGEIQEIIKRSRVDNPGDLVKALDVAIDTTKPGDSGSVRTLGGNRLQVLTRARKKLDSLTKLDMLCK
jgi:hypothetical protein